MAFAGLSDDTDRSNLIAYLADNWFNTSHDYY
jgi:cytochrome c2